ncbi:winged helix DNA-binding domain-containing protein [Polymorphospora lycopeni]|uniref:Winged helix DNA-binding domain-containing protein n=1 Tax=Polymorphospora lycopeni TaxID=3140240 RepID=A0ABV5CTY4_9ACTN
MTERSEGDGPLSGRALNRALLARQGLIDPFDGPLTETVESVGAIQAQQWTSPPVALWSRRRDFTADELWAALDRGDLVTGILLRRTLHLVSAREHPAYAVVATGSGVDGWQGLKVARTAGADRLLANLLAYAGQSRTGDELHDFVEAWVEAHPGGLSNAEVAAQRAYRWRVLRASPALVRVPADGRWAARTPAAYRAAAESGDLDPDVAHDMAVRRHLRAFGPAGADDVAYWLGVRVPVVRAAVDRIGAELVRFADEDGRVLYDLPDAPRPGPDGEVPVRFLPAFDSALLAYAAGRRTRILPDAYRDRVYVRANLRWLPTVLVDGFVAGVWATRVSRRVATVTVTPFGRLPRGTRAAVTKVAERLIRFVEPAATDHQVVVEG